MQNRVTFSYQEIPERNLSQIPNTRHSSELVEIDRVLIMVPLLRLCALGCLAVRLSNPVNPSPTPKYLNTHILRAR